MYDESRFDQSSLWYSSLVFGLTVKAPPALPPARAKLRVGMV